MANGIALDPIRQRLYIAASRLKKLYAYAWDAGNPARGLTDRAEIAIPGYPDNLESYDVARSNPGGKRWRERRTWPWTRSTILGDVQSALRTTPVGGGL